MSNEEDYTLVHEALKFGGNIKRSVDLQTGEVMSAREGAEVSCGQETAPTRGHSLSTAHKRPFIEWTSGARLLKVSGGGHFEQSGGGKRGKVKGFSRLSRRRLMQTIAKIQKHAELPLFVTLTYPNKFPSPKESKRDLKTFLKRVKRHFPEIGCIWKLEPQERGAPHYHMLAWGVSLHDLFSFVVNAWFEIAGDGDNNHLRFHMGLLPDTKPCVAEVRSFRGVWSYASKYLGKTFEVAGWEGKETGRYWAVVNKENIPFGTDMVMRISLKDAHKWNRYQRRFAKLKGRDYPSITTFCDADQWVENVLGRKVNHVEQE